jgi:hypothetical protein
MFVGKVHHLPFWRRWEVIWIIVFAVLLGREAEGAGLFPQEAELKWAGRGLCSCAPLLAETDSSFELAPSLLLPKAPGWETHEGLLTRVHNFLQEEVSGIDRYHAVAGTRISPPARAPRPLTSLLRELGGAFVKPFPGRGAPSLVVAPAGIPHIMVSKGRDGVSYEVDFETVQAWGNLRKYLTVQRKSWDSSFHHFEDALLYEPYRISHWFQRGLFHWLDRNPNYLLSLKRRFLGPHGLSFDEALAYSRFLGRGFFEASRWAVRLRIQQEREAIIFAPEDPIKEQLIFYSTAARSLFSEVLERSAKRLSVAEREARIRSDDQLADQLHNELGKFDGVDPSREIWNSLSPDGLSVPTFDQWKEVTEKAADQKSSG